jgi:hypothetical protein
MAKGDDSRARNQVNYQGNLSQNHLNNLRNDTLIPQNQDMWNSYKTAQGNDAEDYGNIKGKFEDFSKTGGYSDQDIGNIRARSISPIRSIYAGANREVDRSRALQGGYSPGYGVLKGRMARDMSSQLSDATTNAEGMIAQLRNQGKQFGASGLLSAYGTTPARSNMAGNQALDSTQQRIQGENLQGNLSNSIMGNTIQAGQLPGKGDYIGNRISQGVNMAAGVVYPWLGSGGSTGWNFPGPKAPM